MLLLESEMERTVTPNVDERKGDPVSKNERNGFDDREKRNDESSALMYHGSRRAQGWQPWSHMVVEAAELP